MDDDMKREEAEASPVDQGGRSGKQAYFDMLQKGLYGILLLLVLVAAIQLYFSVQEIISSWLEEEWVPVFNSIYYLAVIGLGLYLIKRHAVKL
jgi:hypothetical protein